jgi:hypothetical protein
MKVQKRKNLRGRYTGRATNPISSAMREFLEGRARARARMLLPINFACQPCCIKR